MEGWWAGTSVAINASLHDAMPFYLKGQEPWSRKGQDEHTPL